MANNDKPGRLDYVKQAVPAEGTPARHLFIVVNQGEYGKWRTDKSIPVVNVVQNFEIYTEDNHQKFPSVAANAILDEVFGTHNKDDAIAQILERGTLQDRPYNLQIHAQK
eukprot:TRINITY_DN2903_c0_g1_i2.p1 TRINITY_DN2903_c0_g1~~TRINITY_DN2903_c0_g1_i2.p1  ORF type:complete len:110 (+),score=35.01 TRINITY_DN2903_c0_g1_i2:140-469(+)